ncbi:hypothetical protein BIV03_04075 [Curtobacterium sp. MCBA15_016]|uniref:hypothetical protein n=1 Tax=Curtobacterium sp. MCBA15_016 TaxID=1898740 RepID=UPI0008DC712D|nr:hypothetical protein [Curtobacterium sp. MCBA15_016]OII18170.1 hypothetical protein BIV03_04075 [Curtobacterium sp. MCBA15_016]
MAPAAKFVAPIAVLLILATSACSQADVDPPASYIGKPVSVLTGRDGPRGLAQVKIKVAGQKRLGAGVSGGRKIILAICSSSADVSTADQADVGYLREGYVTRSIKKKAEAGDFLDQLDCGPGLKNPN